MLSLQTILNLLDIFLYQASSATDCNDQSIRPKPNAPKINVRCQASPSCPVGPSIAPTARIKQINPKINLNIFAPNFVPTITNTVFN